MHVCHLGLWQILEEVMAALRCDCLCVSDTYLAAQPAQPFQACCQAGVMTSRLGLPPSDDCSCCAQVGLYGQGTVVGSHPEADIMGYEVWRQVQLQCWQHDLVMMEAESQEERDAGLCVLPGPAAVSLTLSVKLDGCHAELFQLSHLLLQRVADPQVRLADC